MKKMISLAIAGAVALAGMATSAQAREGCGPGAHRGPHGYCRPNGGWDRGGRPAPDRWVVGRFYEGRGYWDGRRWYHNRGRWHDGRPGWRYW